MLKKAIVYMLISALAFALLNVFVKRLGHFNVYQIVFFRSLGSLFFTIPILLKNKLSFFGNKSLLLTLRSVFGFVAMTLFFMAINNLSIGLAVSVRYISPIFAAIFAIFLLKEQIKWKQWLFFALACLGVFVIKGLDGKVNDLGLLLALCSAVFTGLVFIIIRKIGKHDHPMVIVNHFMIISTLLSGLLCIQFWIKPNGLDWLYLMALGVFGYFGQYYMTKALQSSEINQVAPLKYIEVVFTMIIGFVWLKEIYNLSSIIGILLIVTALVLNIRVKRQ